MSETEPIATRTASFSLTIPKDQVDAFHAALLKLKYHAPLTSKSQLVIRAVLAAAEALTGDSA